MKDKKGNIPITILVIGVFLVCTLAIFSFLAFLSKTENSFAEKMDLIEKANSAIEKSSLDNYHEEIVDNGFWFFSKEKIIFSVDYTSP